jgi:hypothetical protein
VPLGSQDLAFEEDGLFLCAPEIAALSALSYALPGDRAADREGARILADDDLETCCS